MIIAAYNNARENLQKKSNEELSKLTGGLVFHGFKFPFLMSQNIPEIEELVKLFSKLPGLGPKSAKRISA